MVLNLNQWRMLLEENRINSYDYFSVYEKNIKLNTIYNMKDILIIYTELAQCSIDLERLEKDNFEMMLKLQKLKSDITTKF